MMLIIIYENVKWKKEIIPTYKTDVSIKALSGVMFNTKKGKNKQSLRGIYLLSYINNLYICPRKRKERCFSKILSLIGRFHHRPTVASISIIFRSQNADKLISE